MKSRKSSNEDFDKFSGTAKFVATPDLIEAVNASIALEIPLFIKGEPGTGKTVLAGHIADSLGKKLLTWNIKSYSKARDGLYVYDTVTRLHDSRFEDKDVSDIKQYIDYGPLGRAFMADEQVVVLIDEIDKADIEFGNDLLNELDMMYFDVMETGDRVEAIYRPIILITSNSEKEMPDAFLRRCAFHYINFPEPDIMDDIVRAHYPDVDKGLLNAVIDKFYQLRQLKDLQKKPATSELLNWLVALQKGGISIKALAKDFPFIGLLLKKEKDLNNYRRNYNLYGGGGR
jgi:MoxR-like ATPase